MKIPFAVPAFGRTVSKRFAGICAVVLLACACTLSQTKPTPVDPGVRGGSAGAGGPLSGLTADEAVFFQDGQGRFAEIEVVQGGSNNGLGPRFNSNQCLSCHAQPKIEPRNREASSRERIARINSRNCQALSMGATRTMNLLSPARSPWCRSLSDDR
jgi:hypothetical protein